MHSVMDGKGFFIKTLRVAICGVYYLVNCCMISIGRGVRHGSKKNRKLYSRKKKSKENDSNANGRKTWSDGQNSFPLGKWKLYARYFITYSDSGAFV